MNRKIYREIARKNNVSVGEVKRDMQAAVDQMYIDPTEEAKQIKSKGEKPSVEEVIEHIVRKIKD